MKDPPKKAKAALQTCAKLVAMHVRNEMEDFHCKHLDDAQMKELNPIIRKAIYQTLRNLFFLKKGTKKQRLVAIQQIHFLFLTLPDYWEHPDLNDQDRVDEDELSEREMTKRMGCSAATDAARRSSSSFGIIWCV
jgi:hypothetical protein